MTKVEGWNVDWLVTLAFWLRSLFTTTDRCSVCIIADPPNPSVPPLLSCPLTCTQDSKILFPRLEGAVHPFLTKNCGPRLGEVHIFIPVASHSPANHLSAFWRSVFNGANGTTSSAKSSNGILTPPTLTSFCRLTVPRNPVHKRINRIGDRRQPWGQSYPNWE